METPTASRKKHTLTSFKRPKWPIKANKKLHLKMLSCVYKQATNINTTEHCLLKALKFLNLDRLKLLHSKRKDLQSKEITFFVG